MLFRVSVYITKFKDTLDPAGIAVKRALHSMGHTVVEDVRIGRMFEFDLEASDEAAARVTAETIGQTQVNTQYERLGAVIVSAKPG